MENNTTEKQNSSSQDIIFTYPSTVNVASFSIFSIFLFFVFVVSFANIRSLSIISATLILGLSFVLAILFALPIINRQQRFINSDRIKVLYKYLKSKSYEKKWEECTGYIYYKMRSYKTRELSVMDIAYPYMYRLILIFSDGRSLKLKADTFVENNYRTEMDQVLKLLKAREIKNINPKRRMFSPKIFIND